ncbi:hypothetical protein DMENIID0001_074580 [Sergentomyia squamirostris]
MGAPKERANLVEMFRDLGNEPNDAELPTNTHFPHLNTREYMLRMTDPGQNTDPQEFHECFDINRPGNVVMAINDYRTRFQVGHFWGFQSVKAFKERGSAPPPGERIPITNPPITALKFVQDGLIALGRTTGTIETWSTNPSMNGYFPVDHKNEHVGIIMDLDVFSKTRSKIVSVDNAACIKLWNVNFLDVESTHTFHHAHGDSITGVSTRPGSDDIFVSVSRDRSALIWDRRQALKPASGMLQKHKEHLTAVAWVLDSGQEETHLMKVGDNSGSILTLDMRNPNEIIKEISAFNRPVKRIKCSEGFYAVCGLTNIFKIYNINDQLITEDTSMTDFIRDVVFHGKKVVSLCWNGEIIEKSL